MRIMITAYRKGCWYGDISYIGKQYEVVKKMEHCFSVKDKRGIRQINKCDCVVI